MTRYATLTNGRITYAPKKIKYNGCTVMNPSADKLLELGYLPVEYTDAPEAPEGHYYVSGWEQTDSAIVQTWTLSEEVITDEISDSEALSIITGGTA